jgi:hypothetical protein
VRCLDRVLLSSRLYTRGISLSINQYIDAFGAAPAGFCGGAGPGNRSTSVNVFARIATLESVKEACQHHRTLLGGNTSNNNTVNRTLLRIPKHQKRIETHPACASSPRSASG